MIIDVLVEGTADEFVAQKVIRHCGLEPGTVYGRQGVGTLRAKLVGFNVRASFGNPILALVDFMDTRLSCPPEVAATWLPDRSPRMLLRVVVPELEAWLLADRDGFARYFGVGVSKVPEKPELEADAKQTLVNLARRSNNRRIRRDVVPIEGFSASVGPGYVGTIRDYVNNHWSVHAAETRAISLQRCLMRLMEYANGTREAG